MRKSVNGKRNYVYFSGSLTVSKKDLGIYDKIILRRSKTILPSDEPLIAEQLGNSVEFIDLEYKTPFVRY
jgi:hypothetical protein